MFELMHPWWLLLLLALPLVFLRDRLGDRARVSWGSAKLSGSGRTWRTRLAPLPRALQVLGLALCVVALSRPQLTERETVVESEGIDILLALDVSGSMDATDFNLNGRRLTRLEMARSVVSEFVEGRPNDRIGLVVFGEEAFTQVPLTLDHIALQRFLARIEIGMAGENATAVGYALAVATKGLDRLEAPSKVVVLLTDGVENVHVVEPLVAAQAAKAVGVRVYTVGMGGDGGRRRASRDPVDEATLRAVAETTGGQYFRATDSKGLAEIYATIDELEVSTARVKEYVHRDELYRRFLVPGLLLVLLQMLLEATLFRRLP